MFNPRKYGPPTHREKKTAFLLGKTKASKQVEYLVKLHDWAGKAIRYYDLLDNGSMIAHLKGSDPDFKGARADCEREGWRIEHPNIPFEDEERWFEHAQREAKRLGLTIARHQ
jgi:hypothetical protein